MDYPVSNLLLVYSEQAALNSPMISTGDALTVQQVQSVAENEHPREDLSVFFGIGMTANIIMVVAFVIWGIKQWKKNDIDKK